MTESKELKIGLVGAAGRGGSFAKAYQANGARIHAVCDVRTECLDECMPALGAKEKYASCEEMLDKSDIDAVFIGTPMQFHVPQAIAALERGKHVLSEVTAGVSMEECRALVEACAKSKALYMLAENYIYMKENSLISALASQGLFGEPYYAEGEYLHELKAHNETTPWRRKWQTGIVGITYVTHSLGPILKWMPGDRVARVCCENTGSHFKDPRGEPYAQDSGTMLAKTVKGALIKIRLDMISDRPHSMTNYQIQGTDGAYESGRQGPGEHGKIWLRALSREPKWLDVGALMQIDEFAERYLPDVWRNPPTALGRAGHGGGDFLVVRDFVRAVRGEAPCPIGIHEAMDMTLPGLCSQLSNQRGGEWVPVPDSRQWVSGAPQPQLRMRWPEDRLNRPPDVRVAEGYELRQFALSDAEAYSALRVKAGFGAWDREHLERCLRRIVPDGFFVAVHRATGTLAASAMALHNPQEDLPSGGELGWVCGDPEHKGKGLGMAVSAAATRRLIQAGYRTVYLLTDDHRLPALKIYLQMGFVPDLYRDNMPSRWEDVRSILGMRS